MMEESQNSKMSAVLGGGNTRSGSEISASRDDSGYPSYDDSISKLW